MSSLCSVTTESASVFLSAAGKKQWKERGKKEVIVLVDEGSTAQGLGESLDSTPILALKDAITKVGCVGVRYCVSWKKKLIIRHLLDCCYIANSSRDDKLSERVKKIPEKKMGPSWGLNPGPSEY